MIQYNLDVSYKIIKTWPTKYQVEITLKNNSDQSTSLWISKFKLSAKQSVLSYWNCSIEQDASSYVATGKYIPAFGLTTYEVVIDNPYNIPEMLLMLTAYAK